MAAAEPRSFGVNPVGSTGHLRRTHGRNSRVQEAAPQAVPRSFGVDPVGSTGHFRRTHGRSPSVLKAAPQAVPQGIFLAKPEQVGEGIRLAVKDLFDTAGLTTT